MIFQPPLILHKIFPNIIWRNKKSNVIISIDDGPNPNSTERIIKILEKYKIKAIFFITGKNLLNFKDFIKQPMNSFFIANHTFSHDKYLIFKGRDKIYKEIKECEEILTHFPNKLNLVRPPHGYFNKVFLNCSRNAGLKVMMWDVMTEDYRNNEKIFVNNLKNNLNNNSIIVMHDNQSIKGNDFSFLEIAISIILEKGYSIESDFSF